MEPHSKKFKIVLGSVFIFVLIVAIVGSYISTKGYKFQAPIREPTYEEIVLEEEGELTEEFYNVVADKTYQEIKSKAPENVRSPNLPYLEQREKLIETANIDEKPYNQIVVYDEDGLSAKIISITQGDLVTFKNNSNEEIVIIGEDDWKTYAPVKPGEGFSQRFDFLGSYNFQLEGKDIEGVIMVGKSSK